ncbi:unnamed protein product [Acanthocheilonema viteae]|uniref:EGF-like domain-containing protein n=1 Tax=Acanthocheilonema viteae TaxID=6277 RepID=A0A498RXS7_ACAVI|nr:unnamed protein product [Acanthocheilonema viteae]
MRHSMRMNRAVHGKPQEISPPFQFLFMDAKGYETRYYEPGKIYTIRLVGFVHFRGLLLQGRLANEDGFLLGSLKGGRFIENENWETFGIRMQDCSPRGSSLQDSVTHSDDSEKFIVQLEWTTDKDIGAVQFMLTIAEEDEIYWERWRPESGFIIPISWKGKDLNVISGETMAVKLSAQKRKPIESLTSSHYKQPLSAAEKTENFTIEKTHAIYEKYVPQRPIPETLRDLAYRHENEVEEELREKASSTTTPFTAPLWKSESSIRTGLPLIRTTTAWQFRNRKPKEIEHVYESRFPEIFVESLGNEPTKTKVKMASVIRMDKCLENPCENGGRCHLNNSAEVGFTCFCKEGWTGLLCQSSNLSFLPSYLIASSTLAVGKVTFRMFWKKSDANKGSVCRTQLRIGKVCQLEEFLSMRLLEGLRWRNGTCVEKSNGELGCKCPPGAAGRYCERGPCQDIYGSCNQWKQQGQCKQMRHHTRFFDINCAASCGQCSSSNHTVRTTKPLAPVLLPLAWMIGVWKAEVNGTPWRTVDYVTDFEAISYTEILAVTVADVLMFGKPSINFTSIAINRNDTTDQHIHYGFLTVGPNSDGKPLVALITASNLGQIMVEEGEVRSNSVQFTPTYRSVLSHTANSLPLELHRTFSRNDKRLVQSLTKKDVDGRNRSVSKRYDKIVDIEYL